MNNLHLVLGGPGCGKTTRLLDIVEEQIAKGISASKIAFVAFTKAAAQEAKERAALKFGLDPEKDLPWFRTIHSLAYFKLELTRDEVMTRKDWREFSEFAGYQLTGSFDSHGTPMGYDKLGDQMLRVIDYAKATETDLMKAWSMLDCPFDWWTIEQFDAMLKSYKTDIGKHDFADMLQLFTENCDPINVEVAIIDEAQDLTSSQWHVVRKAFGNCPIVYVAGDDDQAIYKWAGADIDQFLSLKGNIEILPLSHRLPFTVFVLANSISERISKRFEKNFLPTNKIGTVQHHMQPYTVDLSEGSWLLLARSRYMLNEMEYHVRGSGIHYSTPSGAAVAATEIQAIQIWEALRAGKKIECQPREVKLIYKMLDRKPPVMRETKTYNVLDLNLDLTKIWHEAFIGISALKREYYISCLRRGEKLTGKPRVRIETIHGVKGAEADNVLLMTDISARTEASFRMEPDNEHRVFYVGVTRAKQNLHLIAPQTSLSYAIS